MATLARKIRTGIDDMKEKEGAAARKEIGIDWLCLITGGLASDYLPPAGSPSW